MGGSNSQPETNPSNNNNNNENKNESTTKQKQGKYKVQLAASVLGGMVGMAAYHTSVIVDGSECI